MLDALRKGAGTWVAKVFLGLLVISFAIWGVADVFTGPSSRAVAKVGATEIAARDFQRNYQRAVQNLSRRLGSNFSYAQAVAMGMPGRVLSEMVNDATLSNAATELGLGISDTEVAKAIRENRQFQVGGEFNRQFFQRVLQSNNLSEDDFVVDQRKISLRYQIAQGLIGGMGVPETYLQAINQFTNEERVIKYVTLKPATLGEIGKPADTALRTYFDANKAQFKAPEFRAITVLKLEPEDVMKPAEVTKDELQDAYESKSNKYVVPEKRQILQVPFANYEAAQAARAKLDTGKTLDDILTELTLKAGDVDLGLLKRSDMIDKAIADAAFALEEGKVSTAIKGKFRSVLLKVLKIEPEKRKPLADVENELRIDIAKRKSEKSVLKIYDEIEDVKAGGTSLRDIADRFKLKLRRIEAVDKSGRDANEKAIAALPDQSKVLKAVFDSDVDVENDAIQVNNRGFLWFDVIRVTVTRDRALDEIRSRVEAAWRVAEINKRLGEQATEMVKALKAGGDLDKLAAEKSIIVNSSEKFKRGNADANSKLPQPLRIAAFGGPEGYVGSAAGGEQERYIFTVLEVTSPAFFATSPELVRIGQSTAEQMGTSLITQYTNKLQSDYGLQVYQTMLSRLVNPSGS